MLQNTFSRAGVHKFFKNLGATSKTLGARRLKSPTFHQQNPQTLGPTIQNLVIKVTWWPECVHPCSRVCIVTHENKSTLSAWLITSLNSWAGEKLCQWRRKSSVD